MEKVFHDQQVRMLYGGTSNHLIFFDVFASFGIGGKEGQELLEKSGISVNMNATPDDTRKPVDPSGIRFGTPAITTRNFKEEECARVAEIMIDVLKKRDDATVGKAKSEIKQMAEAHPVPASFE